MFLELPAELRNQIYEELLIRNPWTLRGSHPSIIATCRQIRDEANELLYSLNEVHRFVYPSHIPRFEVLVFTMSTITVQRSWLSTLRENYKRLAIRRRETAPLWLNFMVQFSEPRLLLNTEWLKLLELTGLRNTSCGTLEMTE